MLAFSAGVFVGGVVGILLTTHAVVNILRRTIGAEATSVLIQQAKKATQ